MTPSFHKRTVVIVGGGFAGLKAAKELAHDKNVRVVLLDQRNHHLFQPLLYQVATAGLNPGDIAVPIRSQFSGDENVEVHMEKVAHVDLQKKEVVTNASTFKYDSLVLACGSRHSYFANPEWEQFAPGLKTVEQATEIRRRILSAFERAENETDVEKQKAHMTFVVVGGGPTGVEMAGAIADLSRTVLKNDFSRIDPKNSRIVLLEMAPKILGMFDEKLWQHAVRDLNTLGVEVMTGMKVENIDADGVKAGGKMIPAKTVVWAAGVESSPLKIVQDVEHDKAGRVVVKNDFSIPGFADAFVVGDMASFKLDEKKILPGLAPAAMQAGDFVGKTIRRDIKGEARKPFRYLDKGQMATIGRRRALAQSGPMKLTGFIAWLAWLFIHVFYLIGFKNRISVMSQWVWNYLFSKRGSRLITEREWKLERA